MTVFIFGIAALAALGVAAWRATRNDDDLGDLLSGKSPGFFRSYAGEIKRSTLPTNP